MIVKCDDCGRSFERIKWKIGKRNFCNRFCANRWRNRIYLRSDELTPFRWFLNCSKTRSKSTYKNGRLVESKISLDDLKQQWDIQKGICPYTGWNMLLPKNASGWYGEKSMKRASLDRIDSSKCYTPANIHFVCLIANYAKNNFLESEMLEFCRAVAKRS